MGVEISSKIPDENVNKISFSSTILLEILIFFLSIMILKPTIACSH
jgi:hypothetical protein